ncbi:MAG: hypothetical protein Q4F43_06175 [Eubacteriales bacterium]|nr:hypothetical protein [Eubacteriales bacterium]
MEKIGDGLKKFLLVGIGAAAVTVEKSQQIVDELVKKGEITVEQGKELNKELQHNVKKSLDARKADAKTMEEKVAAMGKEELETLKALIKAAEESEEDREAAEMEDDLKKEGYMPAEPIAEEKAEEEKAEEE